MRESIKTIKRIVLSALFLGCAHASAQSQAALDGYPLANFALTVNVSESGDFFGQILQNPGTIGVWLQERGSLMFGIEKEGKRHAFSRFGKKTILRAFPFVEGEYHGSPLTKARVATRAFCPLGINDAKTSALPLLMLEITCSNPTSRDERFNIVATPDARMAGQMAATESGACSGITDGRTLAVTADAETSWNGSELCIPVHLKARECRTIRVLTAFYDSEWISALDYGTPDELASYGHAVWTVLRESTEMFSQAVPSTGDNELDRYLRWYMIPGVSLTKWTRNNEVLTMGYNELNQRDSYWTTWLHLVFFKELERKMIEESIAWQRPSGKIPTTILPLIEREDDLDINAFFILRIARFYRLYHEKEFLQASWPALKKAMDWLIGRDIERKGIPAQVSFWGDWKDVKGVEGRKYSPFSCLIYMAALKNMAEMGEACGDMKSVARYRRAFDRAFDRVNRDVGAGGLWNGSYYCQIWRDGSVNDRLLQDQTIGILCGVVPGDRALRIIESLNARSLTPYGIAETYPYYDAGFGYPPATYHNGAVWPWVSFMDCWARVIMGRRAEAVDLVKRVGRADLADSGDWSPNEHINSLTGENLGFRIQGWNAGLFGLVYFGLINEGIVF